LFALFVWINIYSHALIDFLMAIPTASMLQEAGFEYNADTPSEINHDVLFREGVTSKVS
jgi:hypothetical protein